MSEKTLNYQGIMRELRGLCSASESGTVYIFADDHQSATITLDDGRITSCSFHGKRNYDALPALKTIKSGQYFFAKGMFQSMDDVALPDTEEVLAGLEAVTSSESAGAASGNGTSQALQAPQEGMTIVAQELARYIGPCASFTCEDYTDEAGIPREFQDLRNMVEAVAADIRNPAKEAQFKEQTLLKLRELLFVD